MSESITTTPAEGTIPSAGRRREEARTPAARGDADAPIAARTDEPVAGSDDATPEPASDPAAVGSRSGRGRKWLHVGRLLLAPVLAAGAVGVHWWVNVPEHVSVSAKDQGAKKDAKKKPPRKKSEANKPRLPGEIVATFERYAEVDFAEEPAKAAWMRTAQSLVNKTVVVARKHAFEGTPEEPRVSVLDVACKTVRCQFVLRSPFPHEIDLLVQALQQVQIDGESIWLLFTTERVDAPKPNLPKDETYVRVTVAFAADDYDDADMQVGGEQIQGGAADTEDTE